MFGTFPDLGKIVELEPGKRKQKNGMYQSKLPPYILLLRSQLRASDYQYSFDGIGAQGTRSGVVCYRAFKRIQSGNQ